MRQHTQAVPRVFPIWIADPAYPSARLRRTVWPRLTADRLTEDSLQPGLGLDLVMGAVSSGHPADRCTDISEHRPTSAL
jgi:hypothetical protein